MSVQYDIDAKKVYMAGYSKRIRLSKRCFFRR
jgi:hypothetical protein